MKRPDIEGYLLDEEGDTLYDLARESIGTVVELGSYKGLSTVYLARGVKANPLLPRVFAVDHFQGEDLEWMDLYPDYRSGNYRESLLENLSAAGVTDVVRVLTGTSWSGGVVAEASALGPIGLVFIDADHSYEAVSKDWAVWRPMLHPRSIVAFHDRGSVGVGRLLDEIRDQGTWDPCDGPGSLSIVSLRAP